ncbi:MAG: hypothetical protein KME25_20600 [Symplocastrum torsivum CPER-KK1]|uniref:Uncharacterized protein n=1 Tax=Symplocastrum torsivum CPER-KK1 TaxID=450513 RepID=A0A951PQB0_9CYAN|nr:hypothetical protein [Symplocastrum torsivum CPER-KK1]
MIKLALKVVRLMFTHSTSDRIRAETTSSVAVRRATNPALSPRLPKRQSAQDVASGVTKAIA